MVEEDFICREGPVVMPEQALLEPAHQKKWKNTLIGKLHITELTSVKSYHVIREINRAWTDKTISNFIIMELGDGMFGFQFEDERDMKWVMDSRPWLVTEDYFYIDGYLLLLTELRPNTPPSGIEFSDSYPFWVQFHGVPYEYVSKEMGKRIGERTGHQVLDVDFDETNSRRMKKYLRVRVLVDITKKLATGCWLLIDKNQVLWVCFKYEELPKLCYGCGIIGHSKDSCSNEDEIEDAIAVRYNPERSAYVSELPEGLVEGQVLRVPDSKGYGCWLHQDHIGSNVEDDEEDEDYNEEDDVEMETEENEVIESSGDEE